jgi:hypothetical protein
VIPRWIPGAFFTHNVALGLNAGAQQSGNGNMTKAALTIGLKHAAFAFALATTFVAPRTAAAEDYPARTI